MARTLAIMAASSWLSLMGGSNAAAEPPTYDSPPELPEPRIETAAVPTTADPAANPKLPSATTEGAAAAATEPDKLQPVKEVTLDPTVKPPVCRRYVPTGSRIATEVCQSAEVADAVRDAERDQTRRDINEMRMRQATQDQARAAAQAEALRRRAGF